MRIRGIMGKEIVQLVIKVGIVYGLFLLFTAEVNPLLWSTAAKIWFIVLLLLTSSDD